MVCDFLLAKENKLLRKKAKNLGFDRVFFVKEVSTLKDIKKENNDQPTFVIRFASAYIGRVGVEPGIGDDDKKRD